jgi:hypothetical protein
VLAQGGQLGVGVKSHRFSTQDCKNVQPR